MLLYTFSAKIANPPAIPNPLRVGSSRTHHPHIHEYFPPFPDPHTYVRSEVGSSFFCYGMVHIQFM